MLLYVSLVLKDPFPVLDGRGIFNHVLQCCVAHVVLSDLGCAVVFNKSTVMLILDDHVHGLVLKDHVSNLVFDAHHTIGLVIKDHVPEVAL